MLRTLSLLAAGTLLAATAFAAPATCSGAKYLDTATGTCKPCGSRTAKTCSSAAVATSCVPRYYLTADGRCVANGQCPTSTFANQSNGKCDKCFLPSYKTCSSGKSSAATSCMNNTCLPATGGRCLPFANIKNTQYCTPAGKIEACPGEGTQTCTVTGTTVTCKAPYFFTTSTSTPDSGDATATFTLSKRISITPNPVTTSGLCVLEPNCPTGTFGNTATRTCSPCGEGASRCTAEGALACYNGYFLLAKKCYNPCPTGKKGLNGMCVDESYCPSAIYEPFTKTCVDACYSAATQVDGVSIPAEYPSDDGKTCIACKSENARECDQVTGLAVSCVDGYALLDGQCYSPCPDGYKADSGKCVKKATYCSVEDAQKPLQSRYIGCIPRIRFTHDVILQRIGKVSTATACGTRCQYPTKTGFAYDKTERDCYCASGGDEVSPWASLAAEVVDEDACTRSYEGFQTFGFLC